MKLIIEGKKYDMEEAITKASVSDLIVLKRATKSKDYPGVSLKTIMESMENIDDPMDFLDSEESLETFRGIIFLCRRKAGERGTVEELTDFPIMGLEFEEEVEDEEEVEAPKAPADGLTAQLEVDAGA